MIKQNLKRKFEKVFHMVLRPFVKLYLESLFNIEVINNPLKEENGAYILLGNHVTAHDPVIINCYTKKYVRFIAGDINYDTPWKKFFLDILGSIPISKNNADRKAVKQLLNFIKGGHPVGLYPEGGRNWSGETEKIIYSTAKLLKLAKAPVYVSTFKGGYLSKARWSQYYKKGKLIIEIKKSINKIEIKSMNVDEIYERIKSDLYHNDYDWQRKNMIPFKGDNKAEHIERVLYLCPTCGNYDTIYSEGNMFYCKSCNSKSIINEYGFIEGDFQYDNVTDWYNWQNKELDVYVFDDTKALETNLIKLQVFSKDNKLKFDGEANFKITKNELLIEKNNTIEKVQVDNIKALSLTLLDSCEFYNSQGEKYRLEFNPKENMSIVMFYRLINKLKKDILDNNKDEILVSS